MTVSMTELMRAARNCFVTGAADGAWRVEGGVLTGDIPLEPGWIGIEGRGAFEVTAGGAVEGLRDGQWQGRVYLLDPPDDFRRLLEDVNAWLTDQADRDGRTETTVETVTSGEKTTATGSAADGASEPVVSRRRESFGAYATETEFSLRAASSDAPATATQSATQRTTRTTTPAATLTSGTTRVTTTHTGAASLRWESVFAARLTPYRRMFPEVRI